MGENPCKTNNVQGFPGVLIAVGHLLDSFPLEVNFIRWKLNSMVWTGTFLLDFSNKSARESNSHYIKLISRKKVDGAFSKLSNSMT